MSTVCEPRHSAGARFIDVIMLIAKAKSVCYNHFVGRRALPVVASRFCYRRREGYAMTPYEIIMVVLTFLSLLIAVDAKNRK